jgi:uncharacterized phage protein (TIGR01671 family)
MREIKFRAWDKSAKKMIYIGDYLNETRKGFPLINFNGDIIAAYPTPEDKNICDLIWARVGYNLKLMQYTDIKDKHGKEIYEGDIIKADFGFIYIVEFFDGSFWLKDIDDGGRNYIHQIRMNIFEIIGNIYENPELLHEK